MYRRQECLTYKEMKIRLLYSCFPCRDKPTMALGMELTEGSEGTKKRQTHRHVDKLGSGRQGSLMESLQHGEAQLSLLFTAEPHPGDKALPFSHGSSSWLCPCQQHTGTQNFLGHASAPSSAGSWS